MTIPSRCQPGFLDAALAYAARGWAIFPVHTIRSGRCSCRRDCSHPAKHPLTRHGLRDATADPTTISAWWSRWPWANIGIATGAISGLLVIDIDPAHGGTQSLDHLQPRMGSLPVTLTAATGGGGEHLFFTHPGQVAVRNTAGRLPGVTEALPGVDLRGDDGYVVAAPSRHASGGAYTWVDPDVLPALAPGWLRPSPRPVFPTGGPARVIPRGGGSRYGLAALRREVAAVRAAPVGGRNDRLNRAAFSLGMLAAGGELHEALIEAELLAAAVDVALPEREARASIRSGLSAGAREPRRRRHA